MLNERSEGALDINFHIGNEVNSENELWEPILPPDQS